MTRPAIAIFFLFILLSLHNGCNQIDIEGEWQVKIKYFSVAKKMVIPVNSIFKYGNEKSFYINGKKTRAKYKKNGDVIRVKVLLKKSKYIVRGVVIDQNTIKGELKKIMTDTEIATWVAKRKK